MTIDLRSKPPADMDSITRALDTLAALGCNLDLPAIKRVRKLQERHRDVTRTASADLKGADGILAEAATALADGNIGPEEVRAAAVAATLAGDRSGSLHKVYSGAKSRLTRRADTELASLGDRWITDVMRPVADTLVADILADIPVAVAESVRPRDPESESLLAGRSAAQVAYAKLRQLQGIATQFRIARRIPATSRDESAWRWNTTMGHRQRADKSLSEFVYLAHRGSTPGVYTEAEAAAAEEADPTKVLTAQEVAAARDYSTLHPY